MKIPLVALLAAVGLALATPAWTAETGVPPGGGTPVVSSEQKPFLGVQVDASQSRSFDGGVVVSAVTPNSTASSMAMLAGDVLVSINKLPTANADDIKKAVETLKVGEAVTVEVLRKNEKMSLKGIVQAKPGPPENPVTAIPDIRNRLDKALRDKQREPSLAEMLDDIVTKLNDLEKNLPKASEAFKKAYPNGEFSITISITIASDKTAKNAVQLGNQGADKQPETPPGDPKSAEPKKDGADATAPKPPVAPKDAPKP